MKNLKSHLRFNKQERNGIFYLLAIIVCLQGIYFFLRQEIPREEGDAFAVNEMLISRMDSLKRAVAKRKRDTVYPFNPNFITDYKGYLLGMSVSEIDRLHRFRERGGFANSAKEFQEVTKVSDSLLATMAPSFRFPDWVRNPGFRRSMVDKKTPPAPTKDLKEVDRSNLGDLNRVTVEELRSVHGIGEVLSLRIVKFRNGLGGFLSDEQVFDVYGISPEVGRKILDRFRIREPPDIPKININLASVEEIAKLTYIRYDVARGIVRFREMNGSFHSFDELREIEGFPAAKIDRIRLYLTL